MEWISVYDRLPKVNGPAVMGLDKFGCLLGSVRFTTQCGNCYTGTDNEGEPVWLLWAPYAFLETTIVLEPDAITHWMPLPEPPKDSE